MKKLLVFLISLIGVLGAEGARAIDDYLITDGGAIVECSTLDLSKYYLSIKCPSYIIDLSENREKSEALVKPRPLFYIDTGNLTREVGCFPSQVLMDNKCYLKKDLTSEICRDIYGFEAQLDEIKKECVCHTGFILKEFSKNNFDCAFDENYKRGNYQPSPEPAVVEPLKAETPVPIVPITPTPIVPIVQSPAIVETPKVGETSVKKIQKQIEPILKVEDAIVEDATNSESVQESSQDETVSKPIITTETKKEPNFIVRFFQAIADWWRGLWR